MDPSLQICMYSQARKGTQVLLALHYTLDMLPERTKATKEKRALAWDRSQGHGRRSRQTDSQL